MKNRFYHYDRERCAFVEVRRNRTQYIIRAAVSVLGVLFVATALTWTLDRIFQTPQELHLMDKARILEDQIAYLDSIIVVKDSVISALVEKPSEVLNTASEIARLRAEVAQHSRILASITDLNLSDRMTVPLLTQSVDQLRREQDLVWNILQGVVVTVILMIIAALAKSLWDRKGVTSALDTASPAKRKGPLGATIVEFPEED